MSCHHETVERNGHTLDVLTEETDGTRLIVDRLGAHPISFARRNTSGNWIGFLWRDNDLTPPPPGVWGGHCTVMGYYIHRLLNERTTYRGHEMRGGTHSFLRQKTFAAPEYGEDAEGNGWLIYTITPDDYLPEEYPYRVTLRLTYTLQAKGMWWTRFRFENGEPEVSAHVSFGMHPGFDVGSPGGARILAGFGRYRRHLAPGNFLSGETVDIDHTDARSPDMPIDMSRLIDSYLLEKVDVEHQWTEVLDAARGRSTTIGHSQAPFVTLWSDGNAFVCVEPCWGLPDAHRQVPFEQKAGVQEIPPGGTLQGEMSFWSQLTEAYYEPRLAYY